MIPSDVWRMALAGLRLLLAATVLGTGWALIFVEPGQPHFEVEARASAPLTMQLYFELGQGYRDADSANAFLKGTGTWEVLRFPMRAGRLRGLRLDPAQSDQAVTVRRISLVGGSNTRLFDLVSPAIKPLQQIAEVRTEADGVTIVPVRGASDPFTSVEVPQTDASTVSDRVVKAAFGASVVMLVVVPLFGWGLRRMPRRRLATWIEARPTLAVVIYAGILSIVVCAPVVFGGKSFLSPNNGVLLLYDSLPTLPGSTDPTAENTQGADVGALAWQTFAFSVIQERSVFRDGELPVWNRYFGSGRTLIGQGQSLIGDPINWATWVVGTGAPAYDARFVILKALFAGAIGVSVLWLFRSLAAAILTATAAVCVTYLLYRLTHPAVLSLYYAPLIVLAWIGLARAHDRMSLRWVVALVAANWLEINSGTVKEAYVLMMVMNGMGALLLLFGGLCAREARLRRFMLGALAMVAFVLMSAPLWGTFLDTVRVGTTGYLNVARADQFRLADLLGYADNLYFLLRDNRYWPGLNMLVALMAALAIVVSAGTWFAGLRDAMPLWPVTLAAMACLAMAFGVVPGPLIASIPFLKSIHHIHNTFATAAIVPLCLICGKGIALAISAERGVLLRALAVVAVGVILAFKVFAPAINSDSNAIAIHLLASFVALLILVWFLRLAPPLRLGGAALALMGIAVVVLVGRGAVWGETSTLVDKYIFNPKGRVDLLAVDQTVEAARAAMTEPTRAIGLGNAFYSGYRAAIGFESIDGPDPMEVKSYRQLVDLLKVPFSFDWRMEFSRGNLEQYGKALDMLNVGVIFASESLKDTFGMGEIFRGTRLGAYRRPNAWPRAFFARGIVPFGNPGELRSLIEQRQGPFVAIDAGLVSGSPLLRKLAAERSLSPIVKASDYKLTNNTTSFTIDAPGPGIAYLAEADQAGDFTVTVNGKRVDYFPANMAFKAIPIEGAGKHRIVVSYWPARLTLYLVLSLVGAVLLFAGAWWHQRTLGLIDAFIRRVAPRWSGAAAASP